MGSKSLVEESAPAEQNVDLSKSESTMVDEKSINDLLQEVVKGVDVENGTLANTVVAELIKESQDEMENITENTSAQQPNTETTTGDSAPIDRSDNKSPPEQQGILCRVVSFFCK